MLIMICHCSKKQDFLVELHKHPVYWQIPQQKSERKQQITTDRNLPVSIEVSRSSARNSINKLVTMGLLEHRQGQGTFVALLENRRSYQFRCRCCVSYGNYLCHKEPCSYPPDEKFYGFLFIGIKKIWHICTRSLVSVMWSWSIIERCMRWLEPGNRRRLVNVCAHIFINITDPESSLV